MIKFIVIFETIIKLGIGNVAYVAWYRFTLRTGLRKRRFQQRKFVENGDFFSATKARLDFPDEWKNKILAEAEQLLNGQLSYYSFHSEQVGNPPDWFLNPFTGTHYPDVQKHWTLLPDFHPAAGDIKNVWEASRFGWVVTLARAYAVTSDEKYRETLNGWLRDWIDNNPLNTGPHWKCGQEASIRLFNLINAAFILNQHNNPTPALMELVEASLDRIARNIRYAIAQDNNHGTSEAAGLLIGGWWLQHVDNSKAKEGERYASAGRHWLENRVQRLFTESGSFSQHSVTYHRVALDTLSFVEFWRRVWNELSFSSHFYAKTKKATNWLFQLTDLQSGDAPNLGSNDGALFLNTHGCDYRDFRPSLQLAYMLFADKLWFDEGVYNEPLYWFNLQSKETVQSPDKQEFSSHGYATLHGADSWAMIKWPYYKFRPSHNDALHVDIWHKGKNIICDSGTYSYNPGIDSKIDPKSVHFHNTVSFDGYDQMPKLSRFLLANWLKPETEGIYRKPDQKGSSWMGSYIDSLGNRHIREVSFSDKKWIITDTLSGNFHEAVIGFNLNTTEYTLKDNVVVAPGFSVRAQGGQKLRLRKSVTSTYYQEFHEIGRFEIIIEKPGTNVTVIELSDPANS